MKTLILTLISVSLVNNVVLSQFLGLCPFLGVSKQTKTAFSMGGAVYFCYYDCFCSYSRFISFTCFITCRILRNSNFYSYYCCFSTTC